MLSHDLPESERSGNIPHMNKMCAFGKAGNKNHDSPEPYRFWLRILFASFHDILVQTPQTVGYIVKIYVASAI